MHKVYLLIGGNQGDRERLLQEAREAIASRVGQIVAASGLYETEPWGKFNGSAQSFLNQALEIATQMDAYEVLEQTQAIETLLGRKRAEHSMAGTERIYVSRPIDIDIICYDDLIQHDPKLTLPHPRMHQRRFVLQPLCEIAPSLRHPFLNKTIEQLLNECNDTSFCSRY